MTTWVDVALNWRPLDSDPRYKRARSLAALAKHSAGGLSRTLAAVQALPIVYQFLRSKPRRTPGADRDEGLMDSHSDRLTELERTVAELQLRLEAKTAEHDEALAQQAALAGILAVIGNSAHDARPVFEKILQSVEHLFGADERGVFLAGEDGMLHVGAIHGPNTERARAAYPMPLDRTTTAMAFRERRVVRFGDVFNDSGVPEGMREAAHRVDRNFSVAAAPMFWEGRGVGAIMVARYSMRPFTESEGALLQSFADQAVIAIQNARLFRETQEALERQTASAEILAVIGNSVNDAQPVFEKILDSVENLFGADERAVFLASEDGLLHVGAIHGLNFERGRAVYPMPLEGTISGMAIRERRLVSFADVYNDPGVPEGTRTTARRIGRNHSAAVAPLLWEGRGVGAIVVVRYSMRPFSESEGALLQSFADQAVIAIQNARLFRETQEALERQTATAEILKVIASSPGDTQPVFDAIAESAKRLLGGHSCTVARHADGAFHLAAFTPVNPEADAAVKSMYPLRRSADEIGEPVGQDFWQVEDTEREWEGARRDTARARGYRSLVRAPLLFEGETIGLLTVTRAEPGKLAPQQIQLLQTFADQAVIAIQNARLFNETQEALERQTATAEILGIIASSPGDPQPVFDAIVESARRLLGGHAATILRLEGGLSHLQAMTSVDAEADAAARATFPRPAPDPGSRFGARLFGDGFAEILDSEAELQGAALSQIRARGVRSLVAVLLKVGGEIFGLLTVARREPGHFAPAQVALLRAFADQAAIAIENARLFNETKEALEQQKAAADILAVIGTSVNDAQPVFEKILNSVEHLFGGDDRVIYLASEDGLLHIGATHGPNAERARTAYPMPLDSTASAIAIRERRVVSFADVFNDPDVPEGMRLPARQVGRNYSVAIAPMLWEGRGVGSILVARISMKPFTEKEGALLQTFADQAVIAIQNAKLFDEVQARTRDLTEALQQQTATAEVLKVISRSAFDLQAVFDTLIASAVELIGAFNGTICLREGDGFRYQANSGVSSEFADILAANPPKPGRSSVAGRVLLSGRVESVPDVLEDPDYALPIQSVNRTRSVLGVPLLRDDRVEGALVLTRAEPGPFTERQIELVQTFADQAVIAIENVRLFDEVQARTRDLSEALQQQTATADVLKVISRSVFNLQAVLDTLADSAVRLTGTRACAISVREGDAFVIRGGFWRADDDRVHILGRQVPGDEDSVMGRVLRSRQIVEIEDVRLLSHYRFPLDDLPGRLGVPLLRGDELVGAMVVVRDTPGRFSARAIELIQTFADQAVIAIENTRLFDEVQARTRDLSEALQQQTATADVLKVISRSAFDLQTVLDTLTVSAAKLCDGEMSIIFQRRGDLVHYVSNFGCSDEFVVYARANPVPANGAGSAIQRAVRDGRTVHIHDVLADPEYVHVGHQSRGGFRTMLAVPLLREGEPIGGFSIGRHDVRPFNQRQIELVETFADQAVIAIENTRLFDEVQARTRDLSEALQIQTATSDVLKVISRSAFDLQAVFNTLVNSAVALAGAQTGLICVRDGDVYRYRNTAGQEPTTALMAYLRDHPATPGRSTIAGRVLLSGKVERIPDCLADPEYVIPMGALAGNVRSLIGVPLIRKDGVEGAIILTREQPGDFSDREVEIVQTFADQAVIAIENSQLLEQVQARTRELAASLDDLRKAQDRLVQSEKLASLGQLTAGIAHEIKNPLNFVNNFSALSRELLEEVGELLAKAKLADAEREEIEDLIGMVTSNLDKVVTHGKRADSIVKNMLMHSREGSGTLTSANVNALVEEAMNLAYHGARAEKPDFKVTMSTALDPNAGAAELYPQEMTRVLLNLISNAFYATAKRRLSGSGADYEPTVTASTRDLGDRVEIAIRDNGTGIPDEVKAKIFNPFFTTKPAGEGTGLGLSLSHDIVVKQHGGTLEVSTQPGAYTEFKIVLLRGGREQGG